MLKKLVFLAIITMSPSLFAHELTSFDSIIDALSSGKQVSVVLHAKQCKVTDPNEFKWPPSSATTRIDTALFMDDKMAFDVTKYARPIPNIAPNGMIQRVSFILEKNGLLNGIISSFDPTTNMKIPSRKDITVDCKLGENVHFYLN